MLIYIDFNIYSSKKIFYCFNKLLIRYFLFLNIFLFFDVKIQKLLTKIKIYRVLSIRFNKFP